MDYRRTLQCVLLTLLLQNSIFVESYKILMVYPSFSKSHLIIATSVMKGLAEEGHEITVVSSFPQKTKIPNYRDVYLELPESLKALVDSTLANPSAKHTPRTIFDIFLAATQYANSTMGLPELQRMMREDSFDMVVTIPVGGRLLSGLAVHFGCPLVYIMPIRAPFTLASYVGNPAQLASHPSAISKLNNPMNFWDRVENVLWAAFESVFFGCAEFLEWYFYRSNFPSSKYPSYFEARGNPALIFSSNHFSQAPSANVPQLVEIGGVQMDVKLAPLPEYLQRYLDQAEEGVIYFSFGTNVQLKKLNQERLWDIIRAVGKTRLKVLLKWDTDETIAGLPDNILVAEWLPQREILAHPNVKLFVSHGGLGSIMESQYYGVPVLGIPMFGNQPGVVQGAVQEGWAVKVEYNTLTEESVSEALQQLLGNPSYAKKVKTLSDIYRDRPMGPLQTAIYWIEYVIRHKGAPHMRSPGADLNVFQRASLDVLAFFGAILYLIYLIIKVLLRGLKAVIGGKPCKRDTKKKKN